jgi:hypothetical protein
VPCVEFSAGQPACQQGEHDDDDQDDRLTTAATRGPRGVGERCGGGAGTGGIICVGLASAGDGARRILGRVSGFRRAARSWSVGGSWRPADGRRWVAGSGGSGVALPRQSGSPGRCGGVTCAIVPYLLAAGGEASKNPPRARSQSDSHVHQAPIALVTRHRHGACRRIFRVDRSR